MMSIHEATLGSDAGDDDGPAGGGGRRRRARGSRPGQAGRAGRPPGRGEVPGAHQVRHPQLEHPGPGAPRARDRRRLSAGHRHGAPVAGFEVIPIGHVRGGRSAVADDHWDGVRSRIELDPAVVDPSATLGLGDFSHLEVVYLFDRVDPGRSAPGPATLAACRVAADRHPGPAGQGPPQPPGPHHLRLVAVDGLVRRGGRPGRRRRHPGPRHQAALRRVRPPRATCASRPGPGS